MVDNKEYEIKASILETFQKAIFLQPNQAHAKSSPIEARAF